MVKSNNKQRHLWMNIKDNAIINRIISKIVAAFFIIITAFYPLFIGFNGYGGMTYAKTLFFLITTVGAVMALLFMFICIKEKFSMNDYYMENEPSRKITMTEWTLLTFISWSLISAGLSAWQNPEWANPGFGAASVWFGANNRYEGLISFVGYALCFIITARFYKVKQLHLQLIAVSAILISLIGVSQFLGLNILGLYPHQCGSLYGSLSTLLRTTLGNLNIVSAYCAFTIMLFSALFTISRSKWQYLYLGAGTCSFALSLTTGFSGDAHKVALLGAMVLLIPYWIFNRERLGRILIVLSSWCIIYAGYSAYMSVMKHKYEAGASFPHFDEQLINSYMHNNIAVILILATVLFGVGLTLILALKNWPKRQMKIIGAVLLAVLFIGGLAGLEIVGSRLSGQPDNIIWQAREMMHGRLDDSFGSNRGWIWRNGLEVIPENPVFGTGPDTFFHALGAERQIEAAKAHANMHDRAHNMFLQIAVCMGIPALIAYLIFFGSIFIPAIKKAFERPILFIFGAAALSYIIQSFFTIEGPIAAPLLWIALGVMASELWQAKIGYKSKEI